MSLGDIATNALSGNPGAQMAQALAGPQPGAQGGGGQQGAMNPSPAPAMAQPQATQSPPDLAKLYMQLYNQQRGAATFDQGLSGLQAAFAPPGQQAAWLAHGNQGGRQDPGAMLQNLMQLRNQQAYQSALPDMLKAAGLDPNLTPLARADPGFLTKAIESQTGIGAPLEQRQYLAAKNAAAAAGQPFPDFRNLVRIRTRRPGRRWRRPTRTSRALKIHSPRSTRHTRPRKTTPSGCSLTRTPSLRPFSGDRRRTAALVRSPADSACLIRIPQTPAPDSISLTTRTSEREWPTPRTYGR